MPSIKLTKRTIDAIEAPPAGQVLYRDTDLPGFGLRVGTKSRVFIAERQVRRRTVRVTLGHYGAITPEQARTRALKALSQMAEGQDINTDRRAAAARDLTLADAFEEFFQARSNLSPNSVPTYRRSIDLYLKEWKRTPVCALTRKMVLDRHRRISEINGPATANNVFRHLRSVLNLIAATHENLSTNPVAILTQARAWNTDKRRRTVIAVHNLPRWWRAVHQEDDYVRDFLVIPILTGMRRSEIARLRWENIDFEGRTLNVPKTKNGDPLELPLSTHLFELLLTRREMLQDDLWVFPGNGASGHLVETKRFYARVAKTSGISHTLHDLRRTFATIAESLDVPHYAMKRLLNHRANSDVTGGYIVIDVERLRGPVEMVAEKILELVGEPSREQHGTT